MNHAWVVFLAALVAVSASGRCVVAGVSLPSPVSARAPDMRSPAAPRIAFLVSGRVYVQAADRRPSRPANRAQANRWRALRRAALDPVSPDGKYRVLERKGPERIGLDRFKVVRRADGVDMQTEIGAHSSVDGARAVFDGWLDATHFAVCLDADVPWGGSLSRRVKDVGTREYPAHPGVTGIWTHAAVRRPEFNGWIGPRRRTAIVLKGKGDSTTVDGRSIEVDPGCASESFSFTPSTDQGPPKVSEPRLVPILGVRSRVDLATFRLSAARAIPLTLAGKPFRGLAKLSPSFDGDPVRRRPSVESSRDGWWALIHSQTYEAGKVAPTEYIASLRTGVVRKLPGTDAVLL